MHWLPGSILEVSKGRFVGLTCSVLCFFNILRIKIYFNRVEESQRKNSVLWHINYIWKVMASGPITSWQIDGEIVETVRGFIFWSSKITADGDCSHEIKRHLFLGRKVMTNLDSILESRNITLLTKVCLVKAMVFPVVMYGCESWTVKKAERRRIDAFELWCWRRLLRSNQSILKEISPGCSLEGLMLKLKLQYCGHLMQRTDSFEKTLMMGTIEGWRTGDDRGWDGSMASLIKWTWVWVGSGSWCWTGRPSVLQLMGSQLDMTERLNWTEMSLSISQILLEHRHTHLFTYCHWLFSHRMMTNSLRQRLYENYSLS